MNRTQKKSHGIGTYELSKIILLCFDDKVHNYFNFWSNQNSFFVKF